jgi:glucose/arabinose dehydrogenase
MRGVPRPESLPGNAVDLPRIGQRSQRGFLSTLGKAGQSARYRVAVRVLTSFACIVVLASAAGASASTAGGMFRRAVVARGFESPVLVTFAPGEREALYVVEQPGRVLRVSGGRIRVVLDIRDQVDFGGERGLLGLAFSPRYPRDHLLYIAYTTESENLVARYRTSASTAIPSTRKVLLSVPDPYSNHNGGNLVFSPDGLLYTSIGDGGSVGDPENRAQNPNSPFGKLLTLEVTKSSANWKIAALGLRNPWRFSFDRATGDLYIGDVGQGEVEEIDFTPRSSAGLENYGWDIYEGSRRFEDTPRGPGTLVFSVFEYTHAGGNCTVIGGYVYRGKARPPVRGRYILGDYCSGHVWSLRVVGGKATSVRREPFTIPGYLTSFGENAAGELFAVSQAGVLYRLT